MKERIKELARKLLPIVGGVVVASLVVGMLVGTITSITGPAQASPAYDFVCFDMYGKYTTHEGVISQTLSYGGTWTLTLEDSTEVYYTQQHGETCVKETSTGVKP